MEKNPTSAFTKNQIWLSQRFLAYKFLTNLWFVMAVWLFFYRLFITDQQIGLLDGIAFAIGLIAEVPSGVMADKLGRDTMVKIGQLLVGGGYIIQTFGSNFAPFVTGQLITMIGFSFVSGADEALFFDQLQFNHSKDWRKLIAKGSQISLVASTAAIILGGWLHTIHPRIPWLLTALSFLSSVFVIWPITETHREKTKQTFSSELREHLHSITSGFAEFKTKKLFLYVPLIITVQGLFYTADWGLLRVVLLDRFHFDVLSGSVVVAISSLTTIGVIALMNRFADRLSEKRTLVVISTVAALSLLASVFDIGSIGFLVIFVVSAGNHILQPFISEILNYRTDEKQRATVLSVASFLRTLPYVALAPVIGFLNTHNKLEYFLVTWTLFIAVALLFYLVSSKRDVTINLTRSE